ncbi:MAG: hypothetical protein ACQEQY_00695 [Halobacteriota archaeon]
MGLLDTVSAVVSEMGPDREAAQRPQSKGAYWCDDCSVRIRDVDYDGEGTPACPECGQEMRFERSPDSGGCAC